MRDMDALVARVRERRGPDCIDNRGTCRKTPESAAFHNEIMAWRDAGKPAEKLVELKAKEKRLRAAGLL